MALATVTGGRGYISADQPKHGGLFYQTALYFGMGMIVHEGPAYRRPVSDAEPDLRSKNLRSIWIKGSLHLNHFLALDGKVTRV